MLVREQWCNANTAGARRMSRVVAMKPVGQRTKMLVSKALRRNARGQDCCLRLDGCQNDTTTTVLAHLRMFGWAGISQKPHDFLAVFACGHCHTALDHRGTNAVADPWDVLRALGETLTRQYESGIIAAKPRETP